MFFLETTEGNTEKFKTIDELKEFIETGFAESGCSDWISKIKDEKENYYGCSWKLEIERL